MHLPDFRGARAVVRAACALLAFVVIVGTWPWHGQTQPAPDPVRIAIPGFTSDDAEAAEWANRITAVLSDDLERSRAFIPLEKTALAQERVSLDAKPRFSAWQGTNAAALLVGHVSQAPGGRLRLAFRLWDVPSGAQLVGEQYYAPQQHWRRLAHVVADAIYSHLADASGHFDTRIAFIEQRTDVQPAVTRLAVMDQDGMNLEYLTDGSQTVMSPRFSPAAQQLVYVVDTGGAPRLILRDLQRGISETVGDFPGLVAAPRFSPNGHRIVMSLKRGGNANLYEMDLRSRTVRRLTETAAIDTQPGYAPSGRHIVFVSGRSGTRQLYVMRSDGSAQQRISRGDGSYAEPAWSPQGDLIAFVKRVRGQSFLCVMNTDGSEERLLASGVAINGIAWAPNGQVLVFSRVASSEQGGSQLFTVAVTGNAERLLETPYGAIDPSWSQPLGPGRSSLGR